jgi:uncharacterized protein YggE
MQYYQYHMNTIQWPRHGSSDFNYDRIRNKKDFSIDVEGRGEVTAIPDGAKLTIGIVTENPEIHIAEQENTTRSKRVIDALRQLGVTDQSIKTLIYSIQPQYDYIGGKTEFRGYKVDHQLEVTVKDIAKAGVVLDTAIKNGANQIGNIRSFISNSEKYERMALKKAVYNAIAKADTIARSIDATLVKTPNKIIEKAVQHPEPFQIFSVKQSPDATLAVPPIQPGEITFIATVRAIFKYYIR